MNKNVHFITTTKVLYIHDLMVKRFGGSFLTSTGLFLKMNSWKLENTHKEEVEFAVKVDNQNLTLDQISKWLKDHSVKLYTQYNY